jgi:hypothetical protein
MARARIPQWMPYLADQCPPPVRHWSDTCVTTWRAWQDVHTPVQGYGPRRYWCPWFHPCDEIAPLVSMVLMFADHTNISCLFDTSTKECWHAKKKVNISVTQRYVKLAARYFNTFMSFDIFLNLAKTQFGKQNTKSSVGVCGGTNSPYLCDYWSEVIWLGSSFL